MGYVGKNTVSCTSGERVQLGAHKSIAVVKTKMEMDLHEDTCVVGDHCIIIHDHNRPVNVFGLMLRQDQCVLA